MGSDLDFVQFVVDQIDDGCEASFRKMFGEYALYSKGKVVALVCDNQLFVKPTAAGRNYIRDVVESPPYPGAKISFLIQDQIEDSEWLSDLIALTEQELPMPRRKAKRKSKKNKAGR